ncbi:hypothetical protein DB346_12835 [Verrucomicrobia bacterium LW23]|nr:hypothetical protein DB346_12835 [Verrucomicrobia bacterium LW23]
MKRMNITALSASCTIAFLSLLWLSGTALAQAEKQRAPLPSGPLIQKRMPAMSQWTVSTVLPGPSDKPDKPETSSAGTAATPESARSAKPQVILEQTFTKTHDIIRMDYVDKAKMPWTVWAANGFQILITPEGKVCGEVALAYSRDNPNTFNINFGSTDFPGFEWITASHYQDVVEYEKIPCMLFRDETNVLAYINVETRQPVALQNGERTLLYTYKAPPAAVLTLPPHVDALIQSRIKALKQLTTLPVSPF